MHATRILLAFVVLTVAAGVVLGLTNAPGDWYQGLAKPAFNPPNWIFAPVWTVLYVLVAIAGARVWVRGMRGAITAWFVQIGLNFIWSPIVFSLHALGGGLVVIVLLLVAILVFIGLVWRSDRLSALLFAPYALWVAFATLLNASLFSLN